MTYPARRNDRPHARTCTGRTVTGWPSGRVATRRVTSGVTCVKTAPTPGKPDMSGSSAGFPKEGTPGPALNSTSPSRPLNITAGRHQRVPGPAAMLRTDRFHGLPSAVPEANTPPGAAGFGTLTVTVGGLVVWPPVACADSAPPAM